MDREALRQFILARYNAAEDHPWAAWPGYAVFRHPANKKWFALLMDLPKSKLGLPGESVIDVLNLKCDPNLVGSLRKEPGFYPAYHMNRENWLSVDLSAPVPEETLRWLLDQSFDLTAPKKKRP